MGFKRVVRGVLRWGLWLLLAWVFARGVVSFLPQPPAQAAEPKPEATAAVEPAGLRAVPEMFAREYFTWSPGGEEERAQRLRPYLAQGLDRQAGWSPTGAAGGQQVEQTWVYGVKPVSPTRWMVTVAARVIPVRNREIVEVDKDNKETRRTERQTLPARTLYLAIPVGQAGAGWVVYDYPSLVPAPESSAWGEPLYYGQETSDEGGRVKALLTDFFKAYLGGNDVTYYLAPGAQLRPMKTGLSFQQVAGLRLLNTDDGSWTLATVIAQDADSGAQYTYRYTVKLADRDGRWYIADMLQKGE